MTEDLWTFGAIAPEGSERADIAGYTVRSIDDEAGRVIEATYEPGSSCVVVETGPWLIGRRVLVPACLVSALDVDERTISVALTNEQIKDSPAFDPDVGDLTSQENRDEVQEYFAGVADAPRRP